MLNRSPVVFVPVSFLLASACGASAAVMEAGREAASRGVLVGESVVTTALRPGYAPPVVTACFAPGTDPEYQAAVMAWVLDQSGGTPRFFTGGRWQTTATNGANVGTYGTPITLTYSFPADGLDGISGGITTQNVLNQKFVEWFGSVSAGKTLVRTCFTRWESVSGLRYLEVSDDNAPFGVGGSAARGDIRIVAINIDGPSNVLAFTYYPDNGDMVIDSSESYGSNANNFVFFRNVFTHESGHGWGAAHVCPANQTKLMEPFYSGAYDGPQHDDIRGVQANYGDTLEPNNTAATGSIINLTNSTINFANLSLHRGVNDPNGFPTDVDYLRLVAPTSGVFSATLSPTGFTYLNGPQLLGGACSAGTSINTLIRMDLRLDIFGTNGTTVLASSNVGGPGVTESVSNVAFPVGGTYYLRVSNTLQSDEPQTYNLSITFVGAGCPGDANGDNVVDFRDLNLILGSFGQSGPALLGDVNHDGVVDFRDLNLVLSNFGRTC